MEPSQVVSFVVEIGPKQTKKTDGKPQPGESNRARKGYSSSGCKFR